MEYARVVTSLMARAAVPRTARSSARVLSLFFLASVIASVACLKTLAEPTSCPGPAVFEHCPNAANATTTDASVSDSGMPMPMPMMGGQRCELMRDTCLQNTRKPSGADSYDCSCRSDLECTRQSGTCYPTPDCPASVKSAFGQTQCLETSADFLIATGSSSACACGCASCAATCDGKGPVLAANQTLRFTLPSTVPQGRLGVMVRARGTTNALTMNFRNTGGMGPPQPVATFAVDSTSFVEEVRIAPAELPRFPGSGAGTSGGTPPTPSTIELRTHDTTTNVEIDCLVVFVTP